MSSRTWLLLNLALVVAAAVAVRATLSLPADIRRQKALTQEAIHPKKDPAATKPAAAKAAKPLTLRAKAAKAATQVPDTWPAIRHGSLNDIWEKSLFSKDRTERVAADEAGAASADEDQLPAPPNFELIGILTANDAKIAIVSLKSGNAAANRANAANRARRLPPNARTPNQPPADANPADAFTPSFATVHENDMLQTTGYRVAAIMPQENTVLLAKDGLTYKLTLDRNSANAAQRRESQNTYAAAVRERSKPPQPTPAQQSQDAAKQPLTPAQQVNANRNRPPLPPGVSMPGRITTPMAPGGTAAPMPMNFQQQPNGGTPTSQQQPAATEGASAAPTATPRRTNLNSTRLFNRSQR
ncbi:MAG: hypothetical protein ACI4WT_06055 [Oligosphaeraceae bacterium]